MSLGRTFINIIACESISSEAFLTLAMIPILKIAANGIIMAIVQVWIEALIYPRLHDDGEIVGAVVSLVVGGRNFNNSSPYRKGIATWIVGSHNRSDVTII